MKCEKISNRQACILTVMYIMANCFSTIYGTSAGRDVWIAHIIATLLTLLLWLLLSRTFDAFPEKDFFDILRIAFGKPIMRIAAFIMGVYAFLSTSTALANFGKFTQLTSLSKTPLIILPLILVLLCAYSLNSGIEVLARCASLTSPFIAFVFVYFLIFGSSELNPDTLTPILSNGMLPVLRAAVSVFINQFGVTLMLTALPKSIRSIHGRKKRGMLFGVLIGGIAVSLISLITVSTLGQAQTVTEFYPTFTLLSIHSTGGFIRHMEILTSVASAFLLLFRAALGLNFLSLAIRHIFSLRSPRPQLLPLSLLILSATQLLYNNTMQLRKAVEGDIAAYVSLPIQLILPTFACALAYIKLRKVSDKLM